MSADINQRMLETLIAAKVGVAISHNELEDELSSRAKRVQARLFDIYAFICKTIDAVDATTSLDADSDYASWDTDPGLWGK